MDFLFTLEKFTQVLRQLKRLEINENQRNPTLNEG